MRDVTAAQRDRMNGLASATAAYFEQQGYQAVHTPLLEQTELFVRKSGGDLVNSLYTFQDPGGNTVSLRPEFTSSVIRHYVEVADTLRGPVRWQYGGPVFRYETDAGEGACASSPSLAQSWWEPPAWKRTPRSCTWPGADSSARA